MLTPDQIRALKPGPELDRAVYHALFDEQASLPGPRRLVAYPSYSATWKALGLVVEEMERRGYHWSVSAAWIDHQKDWGHFCTFGSEGSLRFDAEGRWIAPEEAKPRRTPGDTRGLPWQLDLYSNV